MKFFTSSTHCLGNTKRLSINQNSSLIKTVIIALGIISLLILNTANCFANSITIASNTNWSAITTGSGAAGIPSSADAITVNANATLTVNVTNAVCASLQLGRIGTGTTQQGTLTFSGTNASLTVSGAVVVGGTSTTANGSKGTITFISGASLTAVSLQLGNTGGSGNAGVINMTSGGSITVSGAITTPAVTGNSWTFGAGAAFNNGSTSNTLTNAITLGTGGANFNLSGGGSLQLTGAITGGGGFVTAGSDFILNTASTNAIGSITVNSARLFVFTSTSIANSTISVANGATVDFGLAAFTLPSTNHINLASGACLANRGSGTLTVSTTTVTFPTTGNVIFNNDDQVTTTLTVTGNYPTLTGNLIMQIGGNNTTVGTVTLSGIISGTGFGINKTLNGTLVLSGANTYTGGTTISEGTLSISSTTALGSSTGALAISSGASATVSSSVTVGNMTLGGLGTANGTWGSTAASATFKNGTYFGTTATGLITVGTDTRSAPTVTVTPGTYTYTRTSQGPASGVTTNTGTGASYTFTYVGISGTTYASSSTAPTNAGNYDVTATVAASSDGFYSSANSSATAFSISPKALTAAGTLVFASKVYNGTTTAIPSSGSAALQTAETAGSGTTSDGKPYTSDVVSLTGTAAYNYNSKDVSTATTVTENGLSLTGTSNANYTLTAPTFSTTITTKALTQSGLSVPSSKIYDGTTTAAVSGTAILQSSEAIGTGTTGDGIPYTGDVVSITGAATGTYNSKDVASAATVSFGGLSLTGTQASNYSLTSGTASATITAKAITESGLSASTKVYDGTTSAVVSGTAALQTPETSGTGTTSDGKPYSVDVVSITGTATGTYNSKDVATATTVTFAGISLTGAQAGDYTLTIQSPASATITAKALTAAGTLVFATKVYDGTTTAIPTSGSAALQTTETGGTGTTADGKPYTGDVVSLTGTAVYNYNSKDVVTAATITENGLSLAGANNGNYTLTAPTFSKTITAKAISESGLSVPSSKVYNGTTAAVVSGTASLQSAEATGTGTTSDGIPYTGDVVSITGTATGTYNSKDVAAATTVTFGGLSLTGSQAGDYTLTFQSAGSATITAKAITESGLSASTKVYDGTTAAIVSGTAALQTAETAGAGTTADGKPYSGDVVSITGTATGTYNSKDVATATTVTFGGISLTGAQAADYTLTIQSPASATITAKALTAAGTLVFATKVYDGTTTAIPTSGSAALQTTETGGTGTIADGKPYTGDVVSLTGTVAYNYNSKDVATAATIAESGLSLTGANNGNYTLTAPTFSKTITAKAISESGLTVPSSKVYNGTTAAVVSGTAALQSSEATGTGTTSDGIPYTGDVVSITGTATGTYNSKDVASATTVTFGGLSLTGAQAGDYSLTFQSPASATITTKAITESGLSVPTSKVYNGTTAAVVSGTAALQTAETAGAGTTIDGKPYSGDVVSITGTATGTYNSKDVATASTVTFGGISLTGAQAGDYSLTIQNTASATITVKALTALGTLVFSNKPYDGTTTATPTSGSAALQTTETGGAGTTSDGKPYTGDVVSLTGTAAYNYNSADVATATTITESGLSLTGSDNGDYTLTAPTFSNTITPLALNLTATRVYDGTTNISSSAFTINNNLDGSNLTISGTGVLSSKDVGTRTISNPSATISRVQAASGNTGANAVTSFGVTLGAAPINGNSLVAVISTRGTAANQVSSITQTGATWTRAIQASTTSGATSEIWYATNISGAGTSITINLASSLRAAAEIMEYKNVLAVNALDKTSSSSSTVSNTASTGTTATTTQANELFIGGISLTSSADGMGTPTNSFTLVNEVVSTNGTAGNNTDLFALEKIVSSTGTASSGGTLSGGIGGFQAYSGAIATFKAGNVLTLGGSAAGNYTLSGLTGSVIITAKPITTNALSVPSSKIYNATTAAVITGTPALQTPETAGTGTATDGKPYSVDAIALSGTATATYNSKDVATANTVTFGGLSLTGTGNADYTLTIQSPVAATITAKPLSETGLTASNKTYDGTDAATITGTAAFMGTDAPGAATNDGKPYTGDAVSIVNTATGTFASVNVGTAITVTEIGQSLSGVDAPNYNLTLQSLAADIDTASLFVTADNKIVNYGDATPSLTYTITGFVNSENQGSATTGSFSLSTTYVSGTPPSASPVTIAIAPGTFAASNYGITYVNGTITINTIISMWNGGTSNDWNDVTNWSNGIPTQYVDATIPSSASNMPSLTSDITIHDLTLQSATTLTIGSNTLAINGAFSGSAGSGTLTGSSTSNLILGGAAGTLYFTNSIDTLLNLTLNTGATATLGSVMDIASGSNTKPGTLNVGNGATLNTGNQLTLKSTDSSTAKVGVIPEDGSGNALGTISGTVTIERRVHSSVNTPNSAENGNGNFSINNGLRAWRLMTAPVTNSGSPTIQSAWQNNGIPYSSTDLSTQGVGTLVTGASATNGIDIASGVSMYSWTTPGQGFVTMTNTQVPVSNGNYGGSNAGNTGYFIFVRGDRNPASVSNPLYGGIPINNTTLNATGNLITGRQSYNVKASMSPSARRFTLIGNPYASPIDLTALSANNVTSTYYIWNPNLNSVGGFVTIDLTSGVNISSPNTGHETQYIQSSEAFFAVGGTGADGTLTFDENNKSDSNNNYVFRPASAPTESFRSNLYLLNADGTTVLADGNLAQYGNFSAGVDFQDAAKLTNINETFSLLRDGVRLAIERRPIIGTTDTLFLNLRQSTQRAYQFQFSAASLNHPGLTGFVKDNYLGDSIPLNLNGNTILSFSINANTASQDQNRFMIVFEPAADAGPLPVTFTAVKASQQTGNTIAVNWNVANEVNIKSYVVEKSTDGKTFGTAETVNATGIAQYGWIDANAVTGQNYYRIRSTDANGNIQYSQVVKVIIGAGSPAIAVYPNPVKDGLIGLQFTNMPKGVYTVKMLTSLGQTLVTRPITHAGGSASETVPFSKSLAKGVYQLEIVKPDNTITTIEVQY